MNESRLERLDLSAVALWSDPVRHEAVVQRIVASLYTQRGPTVLLAEDHPLLRRAVCTALRAAGWRVVEAPDGAVALEILRNGGALDLVVTDLGMPRVGGAELVSRLRCRYPELPALCMSAGLAPAAGGHGGGPIEFLSKPFTIATLLERMRHLLDAAPRP